jgi:hypothetical protein
LRRGTGEEGWGDEERRMGEGEVGEKRGRGEKEREKVTQI